MRRIDVAWFECKCGHRCTAPESINAIAQQMEVYKEEKIEYREESDPITKELKRVPIDTTAKDLATKLELEAKHKGNKVTSRQEGDKQVTRIERSYAQATHDKTELAESNHIILSCPQCNAQLYEVRF